MKPLFDYVLRLYHFVAQALSTPLRDWLMGYLNIDLATGQFQNVRLVSIHSQPDGFEHSTTVEIISVRLLEH